MPSNRQLRTRSWAWLLAGVVFATGAAGSGPPEHVNQISGTIGFTNENPVILQRLNGNARIDVGASSQGDPVFWNYTGGELLGPMQFTYTIDVAATSAGAAYLVFANLTISPGFGSPSITTYLFQNGGSSPVFPEPALDVIVDLEECVGLIDVNWLDSHGDPVSSAYHQVDAIPEGVSGGFSTRAEPLPVRGDTTVYRVEMTRIDAFDGTRLGCVQTLSVNCDEVVQVDCRLPDPGARASIAGMLDMIGKEELSIPSGTTVTASGPFDNSGTHQFDGRPSSGSFLLEGLMASPVTTPPTPHTVRAAMTIAAGDSLESFRPPSDSVLLDPGEAVDLGDTFVMRPGHMIGEIELVGPPDPDGGSCLADLQLLDDRDENGDGIPDAYYRNYSMVTASGDSEPAPGATRSAAGGYAQAGFVGVLDASSNTFQASYEMALAGLFSEPSLWRPRGLQLGFVDIAESTALIPGQLSTVSVTKWVDPLLIAPRQTVTTDYRYCLGQVNLQVWSAEPDRIPYADVFGSLETDIPYDPVYYVSGRATGDVVCPVGKDCQEGTPGQYSIEFCIPEGSHRVHSWFYSPATGVRDFHIPLTVEVGCRQFLSLSERLGVEADTIQECAVGDDVNLRGSVYSTVEVQRIHYRLNGGPEVELCSDCGEDPSFSAEVSGTACANRIDVIAVDVNGNEASLSAEFDCLVETDTDLDDVVDCSDCAPGDAGAWTLPGEVSGLRLDHSTATGLTGLAWDALEQLGATSASYVVLTRVHDTCLESDVGTAESMTDDSPPSPGGVLQFLVGGLNDCGLGSLGVDSGGTARPACP